MIEKMVDSRSDVFIWVTAFVLANLRGTVFWSIIVQGLGFAALPWVEVFIWVILGLLIIRSLIKQDLMKEYTSAWLKNPFLSIFIIISVLSIFWSISASASIYRTAALLFTSAVGAYIGMRYSSNKLVDILTHFGFLLLFVCVTVIISLPSVGMMLYEPYNGSWRGVFWHRNHLGGIAALFNMVFLLGLLSNGFRNKGKFVFNLAIYVFSIVVIFFARSAAGYILFVLMNVLVGISYLWINIHGYLKRIHYIGMLCLGAVAIIAVMTNLSTILGLLGRDSTLTGRTDLWVYLIQDVVSRSPWIGYGFGAIWSFDSFRVSTQQILGWGFPVAIGDNGFLDILLHVGVLGLIPFLLVLMTAFVRFFRYAIQGKTMMSFFPESVLIFAFIANLSFSFFLEAESFVWLILVTLIFSVNVRSSGS